jgi:hypothetical protein
LKIYEVERRKTFLLRKKGEKQMEGREEGSKEGKEETDRKKEEKRSKKIKERKREETFGGLFLFRLEAFLQKAPVSKAWSCLVVVLRGDEDQWVNLIS